MADAFHHGVVNVEEGLIVNPLLQWHIQRVALARISPDILKVTGSWEKSLSVAVETDCHNSIARVERLFNPISMMHVNIDIEDAIVVL